MKNLKDPMVRQGISIYSTGEPITTQGIIGGQGEVSTTSTSGTIKPGRDFLGDARFLTVDEAARFARVSTSTIRNWCRSGLRAFRYGRVIRIQQGELESFLEKYTNMAGGPV